MQCTYIYKGDREGEYVISKHHSYGSSLVAVVNCSLFDTKNKEEKVQPWILLPREALISRLEKAAGNLEVEEESILRLIEKILS